MDAGIREVMEVMCGFGGQPPVPTGAALLAGTGILSAEGTVTSAGNLSPKPLAFTGEGQVIPADQPGDLNRKLPGLTLGLICAVLLVFLVVGDISLIEMRLPPEAQQFMNDAVGIGALVVPFSVWLWRQHHKK